MEVRGSAQYNCFPSPKLSLCQRFPVICQGTMALGKLLPCLLLPLLGLALVWSGAAANNVTIVKTLPGFSGELPFTLETGYVSVKDAELFYYFVESETDPVEDPLLIYLVGGPSCSGANALFLQVGPLAFNTTVYAGGIPALQYYPYGWTQTASIIFIDIPVGSGFSYATTDDGYATSDLKSVSQIISFLRTWLPNHPQFLKSQFFIATDSYSGAIAPVIAQQIINENEEGVWPYINLVGYISGCAHADSTLEDNAIVPYAYRMALVSKPLYEATRDSCNSYYLDADDSSAACQINIDAIDQCTSEISTDNILEPKCASNSLQQEGKNGRSLLRGRRYNAKKSILSHITKPDYWCRNVVYQLLVNWANDKSVQKSLNIREGSIGRWVRCNLTLIEEDLYTYDVTSAIAYHKNLTDSGLQLLFYSGDHDMVVPHIATESWIAQLNITTESAWRPWLYNGQIAGYTVKYTNVGYRLTYATLKGAGHSPTEWKRRECFAMFSRWIHYWPI